MEDIKPIYTLKLKPTVYTNFIASSLANIVRPIRLIFTLIFLYSVSILLGFALTENILLGFILIQVFFVCFIFLLPIVTLLKIVLHKVYTQEVLIQITDRSIITKRDAIEIMMEYANIKNVKVFGDYLFLTFKTGNGIGYIYLKDNPSKDEIISFLKEKSKNEL